MNMLTIVNEINNASNKYKSIVALQYALNNFNPRGVIVAGITNFLVKCEYSKNSQLIAVATIPEDGGAKRLFCNMDFHALTKTEVSFLKKVLDVILKNCKYDPEISNSLSRKSIIKVLQFDNSMLFKQIIKNYGLDGFSIDELLTIGLEPAAKDVLDEITVSIFANPDFPAYVNTYMIQRVESLPGEETEDVLTTERVIKFKRFIGIIAKKLKYGEDADNVVEADENILKKVSAE